MPALGGGDIGHCLAHATKQEGTVFKSRLPKSGDWHGQVRYLGFRECFVDQRVYLCWGTPRSMAHGRLAMFVGCELPRLTFEACARGFSRC